MRAQERVFSKTESTLPRSTPTIESRIVSDVVDTRFTQQILTQALVELHTEMAAALKISDRGGTTHRVFEPATQSGRQGYGPRAN